MGAEQNKDQVRAKSRRRGRKGRDSQNSHETASGIKQHPFKQPTLTYPPVKAVSDDQLEAIHQATLQVLQEIGIDFIHEEAKALLKEAGADVDPNSNRVRMSAEFVEEYLKTVPETFTLHATNPDHHVQFGGDKMVICAMASAPNVSDMDNGRRTGNFEDFNNLIKIGQQLNTVHMWGGYPVEPVDVHASIRHLKALQSKLTLSDKAIHSYSLGQERNLDALEMVKIARQIDDETLDREPSTISIINASSPLRHDTVMLQGIIELSSRNQPIVVTPFTLAGAMAPVTLAGAVTQQNAEALAGIVFTQIVRKGAPVVYGSFTSNVDMRSGSPAFGTPEFMKTTLLSGQLARRYKLPFRASNVNAANTVDAQAAYESVFSLWGCVSSHTNMVKHGLGWMEGGLHISYEKMILDADLLQMVFEYLRPLEVNEDELALDAMREVGPGGHYFGAEHTKARYTTAFYEPILSDWRNYESWAEAGSPTAYQKANSIWKELLASYEPPNIDVAIKDELNDFVERRIREGGVPTDF